MSLLPEEMPVWVLAALGAGLSALCVSFLVINLGLRLLPAGRAFLAAARAEGRLLANPGRSDPPAVWLIFGLATVLATAAGVATYTTLLEGLTRDIWPSGRIFAEGRL
ncbi:MAG: hypothetical protein AAFU49_15105 [Pseudomonadota bacterium]